MSLAPVIEKVLGGELPVAVEAYDGSRVGPPTRDHVVVRSPERCAGSSPPRASWAGPGLRRRRPRHRGRHLRPLELRDRMPDVRLDARAVVGASCGSSAAARLRRLAAAARRRSRLHGRRHSKARDAAAIATTTTCPTTSTGIVLGPPDLLVRGVPRPADTLEAGPGQQARADLPQARPPAGHAAARRRLRLGRHGPARRPAPRRRAVGVTISRRQAELAEKRVAEAGLSTDRDPRAGLPRRRRRAVRRHQLDRHVRARRRGPPRRVLRPPHGCSRPGPAAQPRHQPARPAQRARLPAAQLHRPLRVPRRRAARGRHGGLALQTAGFEVRHVETLREHYALTLRAWVANLEANWDDGRRRGRRGPGPGLAALHGRLGRQLRGRPHQSTRCWRVPATTTAARACRCAPSSSSRRLRAPARPMSGELPGDRARVVVDVCADQALPLEREDHRGAAPEMVPGGLEVGARAQVGAGHPHLAHDGVIGVVHLMTSKGRSGK